MTMLNLLMLPGIMLIERYSTHIGMRVLNLAVSLLASICVRYVADEKTVVLEENVM